MPADSKDFCTLFSHDHDIFVKFSVKSSWTLNLHEDAPVLKKSNCLIGTSKIAQMHHDDKNVFTDTLANVDFGLASNI